MVYNYKYEIFRSFCSQLFPSFVTMMMMQFLIPEPKTKEIVFENVLISEDPETLEQLKELSCKRKLVEESVNGTSLLTQAIAREMNGGFTSRCQQDLHKLGQYLPLLFNFVDYANNLNNISSLNIRWSSTLISQTLIRRTNSPQLHKIDNLMFELGMVLFLYAVKLREKAMEFVSIDVRESVRFLREASGVFDHLYHEILPRFEHLLPDGKFPDLTSPVCSSLSLLCLAEGQAITANKGEDDGYSSGLLSKLHYGITQIISEAYSPLSSRVHREYKHLSTRFLEYISTLGALHELKSQKHLAKCLESNEEQQLGEAIGVLRRALAAARRSMPSKDDTWISIFRAEKEEVTRMLEKYEKLNNSLLQRTPRDTILPIPQGTKIVNLIHFIPTKLEKQLRFRS